MDQTDQITRQTGFIPDVQAIEVPRGLYIFSAACWIASPGVVVLIHPDYSKGKEILPMQAPSSEQGRDTLIDGPEELC